MGLHNSITEEFTNRSRRFWFGLFYIFDQDKKNPAVGEEVIGISFDNDYALEINEKSVSIYEIKNNSNRCSVKRNQKDDFPYCKLLDWYLKDSYLNKISR